MPSFVVSSCLKTLVEASSAILQMSGVYLNMIRNDSTSSSGSTALVHERLTHLVRLQVHRATKSASLCISFCIRFLSLSITVLSRRFFNFFLFLLCFSLLYVSGVVVWCEYCVCISWLAECTTWFDIYLQNCTDHLDTELLVALPADGGAKAFYDARNYLEGDMAVYGFVHR